MATYFPVDNKYVKKKAYGMEQELLKDAAMHPDDPKKLEVFLEYIKDRSLANTDEFAFVPTPPYEEENIRNIEKIINIIREHKLHLKSNLKKAVKLAYLKDSDSKGNEEDKKLSAAVNDIVLTPINLPATYPCFALSGEFILSLLDNNLKCYREEDGTELRKRFKSYVSILKEYLGIHVKRRQNSKMKGTSLWNFCELYDYIRVYPGEEKPSTSLIKTLRKYDESLVKTSYKFNENAASDISNKWMLFETVVFERCSASYKRDWGLYRAHIINEVLSFINNLENLKYILVVISFLWKMMNYHVSDRLKTEYDEFWNVINTHNFIDEGSGQKVRENIDYNFDEDQTFSFNLIDTNNDESIYDRVLFRILTTKIIAYIRPLTQTLQARQESYSDEFCFKMYLDMNPIAPISVSSWSEFYEKYKSKLSTFFPEIEKEELKKFWIIGISILCYCDPDRLNFKITNEPIKITSEKVIMEQEIKVSVIPAKEIMVVMQLLYWSKKIPVVFSGKNTKKYSALCNDVSSDSEHTLFEALKNIHTHYSPELIEQIKKLLTMQTSGNVLRDMDMSKFASKEARFYKLIIKICLTSKNHYKVYDEIKKLNKVLLGEIKHLSKRIDTFWSQYRNSWDS